MNARWVSFILITALVAGFFFPIFGVFEPFLMLLLGVLLWASTLSIKPAQLKEAIKKPKPHALLALVNYLVVPLIFYSVFQFVHFSIPFQMGFMLIAMAPAAIATPFWTKIIHGDEAFALSLMGVNSLLAPFFIPGMMFLFFREQVPLAPTALFSVFAFIIFIPVIAAQLTQRVIRLEKYSQELSLIPIFILLATISSLNAPHLAAAFTLPTLVLVISLPLTSLLVARVVTRTWPSKSSSPFLVGSAFRNKGLILAVALIYFGPEASVASTLLYFAQFFILFPLLIILEKR